MADTPQQETYPVASAADILQLYDAYASLPKPDPAAQNPTPIFPDPADAPEGALPAALEFDGLHGRIICPIEAVPAPALLQHPDVTALHCEIQTIKFDEQPDGNWLIRLCGENVHLGVYFSLAGEELTAMLTRDGVALAGRPSDEALAAAKASAANDEEMQDASSPSDADAPPF